MIGSDRILALNIGASKLVLAEFKLPKGGQPPEMLQYGVAELGIEPESDADPSAYIVAALRDVMKERGIRPGPLLMTLSGQVVFPRFVKLPPVARDKIQQMIAYEAEQNVPFPIGEVVWDHQLVGDAAGGEQNVMIVAVKTDNVTSLTDCVLAVGLEPEIVDVAPLALYNCVRFNYPDTKGCTMVLDIGARSTNLVFIEQDRIFSRSIPVAGNAITQELAKSFQLDFKVAEKLKKQHAFVALGGVYALAEDETADRVSKVVRNVVTRLHAEVNRSINFYRSQQSGSVPNRILLTGGSSVIPHMNTFFHEKLKVEVDYLNPFQTVTVGGRVDPDKAAEDFFELGEVVGLALRRGRRCPIEINLMPPDLVRQKTLRRRIPFFGAAAAALVLVLLTWAMHASRQHALYRQQEQNVVARVERVEKEKSGIDRELQARAAVQVKADALRALVARRSYWAHLLVALRESLYEGMWLTRVEPVKNEEGRIVKLLITGRGYTDKLRQVEEEEKAKGSKLTAVELLRDRLKAHPLLSDEVTIQNAREADRLPFYEFALEVGLEEKPDNAPAGEPQATDGQA